MPTLIELLNESDLPSKDDKRIVSFQKGGYVILVGLNALSNDSMIQTHGHEKCIWFHADGAKGSHVILCLGAKQDPPDDVLKYAAEKALKYSKSECSSVRWARLSDVHKPTGAGVGVWRTKKYLQLEVQ